MKCTIHDRAVERDWLRLKADAAYLENELTTTLEDQTKYSGSKIGISKIRTTYKEILVYLGDCI